MANKYGAIKTKWNGRTFDSKAECRWAMFYEQERKDKRILSLEYQPTIELLPRPHRIVYRPDFLITWANGQVEYIDVKGMETSVFKLKHKMFKHFHPDKKLTLIK